MKTFLWSACALVLACGGSGDVTIDGGGDSGGADGATPSDGAVADSPSGDASSGDASEGGATDAAAYAGRMFVSQGSAGVAVWDGADSLAADGAPTFTMSDASIASGSRGLVVVNNRLVVGENVGGIVAFDGAKTLVGGAAPSAVVPLSSFIKPAGNISGMPSTRIAYNEKTDTLWPGGSWGTDRFDNGATLSSSSSGAALFSHPYLQLPAFAYDATGDRAFLGQISGAGLLAWNGAKSASGSPSPSFTLDQKMAAWSAAIAQDRLYAVGGDTGNGTTPRESIDVWNAISSVSAGKAPDFSITSGLAQQDFSPFVTVANDTLIVCVQSGKVLIWKHASSLTGNVAPDFTLTTQLNEPQKAVLGPVTGRLYVLDSEGVAIYASGATAPTFVAKIKTGLDKPHDLVVLE